MFSLELKRFADKSAKNMSRVIRASSLQLFSAVIKATPVGNPSIWKSTIVPEGYVGGRLRNNWNTSMGSPDLSADRQPAQSGGGSTTDMLASLGKYSLGDTIYFTNNLPYAQSIEDGGSTQRPLGMVKTTIKRWDRAVAANARKANK